MHVIYIILSSPIGVLVYESPISFVPETQVETPITTSALPTILEGS
jgi:hypothetical protein